MVHSCANIFVYTLYYCMNSYFVSVYNMYMYMSIYSVVYHLHYENHLTLSSLELVPYQTESSSLCASTWGRSWDHLQTALHPMKSGTDWIEM